MRALKCCSKDDYLHEAPKYLQKEIMGPELQAFGELFWEYYGNIVGYYHSGFGNGDYVDTSHSKDVDELLSLIEGRIVNFLRRYYRRFNIMPGEISAYISYSRGLNCLEEPCDNFLLRVELCDISVIYSSGGRVTEERIPDYKILARFDPVSLSEGYFFESVQNRPFQKFLQEVLAGITVRSQDEEHDSIYMEWVDSMLNEIAKFLPAVIEVPDYSINPFDFLDENYTVKAYQDMSQEFDDDLSALGLV